MNIEVVNGEIVELAHHKTEGGAFIRVKVQGTGAHNNVYVPLDKAKGLALGTKVRLMLETLS